MKKRFGMWIAIVCILIVGVSVTRMTQDFVVSKGVAASSILSVVDADDSGAAPAGGVQEVFVAENEAAPKEEIHPEAGGGDAAPIMETSPMTTAAVFGEVDEGIEPEGPNEPQNTSESHAGKPDTVAGMTGGPGAELERADSDAGLVSGSLNSGAALAAGPEGAPAYPGAMADMSVLEETVDAKKEALKNKPTQETVKSPLDPLVETKVQVSSSETEESWYTVEDFFERFQLAEESSVKIWENTSQDNAVAYNAAAEQERVLWDYELNLIYDEIRMRMSEEEREELKHLELDWIKERDSYAEKMAAKAPMMNAQKQNPAYTRALAEKTKERCYWLVAEYEELLNRENPADK